MNWRDKLQSTMINVVTGTYVDRFLSSGVEIRGGQLIIPVDAELMMVESYQKLGGGGISFARALSKLTRDNAVYLGIRLLTKLGSKEAPWTGWMENELLELQEKGGIAVNPMFASQEGALPAITHHFVAKESPAGVVMLTEANVLRSFRWNDISQWREELSSGDLAMFSLMKTELLEELPQLVKDKQDMFVVLSPGRIDKTDELSIKNLGHLYNALSCADVLFISYEGLLALVEQKYGSSYYEIRHLWNILSEKKKCPSILVLDWWGQKLVFEQEKEFICGVSTKPESEQGNYCVGINHVWEAAFLLALIQDDKRDIKKAALVAQAAELKVRCHTEQPGMYAPIEEVDFGGLLPYNEEMCKDVRLDESCPLVLDNRIIGSSKAVRQVKREIIRLAAARATVLILGGTGTGKELVARAIHDMNPRKGGKFRAINCAGIPETLLESSLFGYVKGAFTGADIDSLGVITEAAGYTIQHYNQGKANYRAEYRLTNIPGTVFLDEITEMPLSMQAKLLRVIEEKEVTPVGWHADPLPIDVRFIAATNRNIHELVQQGKFRADLFYRLNANIITLSPLRERPEDIPLLIEHFLQQCIKEGMYKGDANWPKNLVQKKSKSLEIIKDYGWPGNVRELKNFVQSATIPDIPEEESNARGVTKQKNVCDVIEKIAESIKQQQEREQGEVSSILPDVTSFVESFRKMLEELYRSSTDKIREEILQGVEQRFFPTMPEQKELIESVRTALCQPDFGDWKIGERTPERDRLMRVLAEIYHKGELSNSDYEKMRFIDNARNANKLSVLLNHLLVVEECPEQGDINAKFFVKPQGLPIILRKYKGKGTRYALSEEFREKLNELLDVNRKNS